MVKVNHDLKYDLDHSGKDDRDYYGNKGKLTRGFRHNDKIGNKGYCDGSDLHINGVFVGMFDSFPCDNFKF